MRTGGVGGSGHRVCPQGCPKGNIICSYSQIYILFLLVPAHLKMFGCELLFPSKISSDWVLLSYIIAILWKIAVLKRMSRVAGIWGLVLSYLLRVTTAHNINSCFRLMEFSINFTASFFWGGGCRTCICIKREGVWPLRMKMRTGGGRGSKKADFLRTY